MEQCHKNLKRREYEGEDDQQQYQRWRDWLKEDGEQDLKNNTQGLRFMGIE